MASNSAKECPICQDEYDEEERCPRVLPCSHTLCSECLQNLIIRNSRTCPFCLRKFTARSARDVGVNTSLLDVLKVLREMEMKVPVPLETPAASKSTRMNDQRRETEEVINNLLGSLKTADDKIDRQLLSNTQLLTYFSEAEDSISNEIQPCINEVLSQNFTRASYVKEHSTRLKNQKMTIDETRKVVIEVKTKLKSAKTFTQIGTASDEVEKIKTDAESSLREFMEQLTEDEKIQLILEKVAKATKHEVTKLKDALNSMRRDDEISFIPEIQQMKISKDLKIHKSISQPVTIGNLRSRTGSVMELIGQRLVFAVQEFKGRSRYAEISLQAKDRICLHCLKEQSIPPNAYIFQHSDVLNLMDVSSRLVFLQLSSAEGITLGKLFIRLSPDSKRAQQFVLLCSGEKTVSYINSTILSVFGKGNKDEFVWMGDYDNMGGKGGRGLVQDVLNEERGVFSRPQKAGTIQGMYNFVRDEEASQFFIYTHESPDIIHDCCFGMVEDGLPILQEVLCRYTEVNKITVSDAGLVLPNKPKMANVARYEILRWIRNMK